MRATRLLALAGAVLGATPACVRPAEPDGATAEVREDLAATPPPPRLLRDVALVDTDGHLTNTHAAPSMRTTLDGRIGVNVKVSAASQNGNATLLELFLLSPEAADGPDGTFGLVGTPGPSNHLELNLPTLQGGNSTTDVRQATLCDQATTITTDGSVDTYSLLIYGFTNLAQPADGGAADVDVYQVRLSLTVTNPKSGSPVMALKGTPTISKASSPIHQINTVLEPMFTGDGKLMVARASNKGTAPGFTNPFNIFYAYLPRTNSAHTCNEDADTFVSDFSALPILYASQDPALVGHYGFAAYTPRGMQNEPLLTGTGANTPDLSGTYPWIDRQGRNLFFFSMNTNNRNRFPPTCVDGGAFAGVEASDQTRGLTVLGSWTNGKAVLLDGLLNNIDYGYGISPVNQANLVLYTDGAPVRFASGRENGPSDRAGQPAFALVVTNPTIVDALENVHNGHQRWRPRTPRDVVWRVSKGHVSEEVAFDDFIDPNVIVNAPMNAAVDLPGTGKYLDGTLNTPLVVQNAATSSRYAIPSGGTISAGGGRIEPAALGGIHGRGLFLAPSATLKFPLQAPGTLDNNSWYASVYVDTSAAIGSTKPLLTVGKLALAVTSASTVQLSWLGNTIPVNLSQTLALGTRWVHLGMLAELQGANPVVQLYVDGNPAGTATLSGASSDLAPGNWAGTYAMVTSPTGGAWFDELKVIVNADWMSSVPEMPCNHAGGTLYSPDGGLGSAACATSPDGSPPSGPGFNVRSAALGTDKMYSNLARPDFTGNHFCTSCHVDGLPGRPDSLDTSALVKTTGLFLRDDPRRQPMVPPRFLKGLIPIGDIDVTSKPASQLSCNSEIKACNVDTMLFPLYTAP